MRAFSFVFSMLNAVIRSYYFSHRFFFWIALFHSFLFLVSLFIFDLFFAISADPSELKLTLQN